MEGPAEAVQMMLLGDAVEHARVGVMVWNAERRYVAVNPKACRLLGVSREALLDAPVGSTNRSDDTQDVIAHVLDQTQTRGFSDINGVRVEWLVFPTTLAGLEHVVGLMWEAETA